MQALVKAVPQTDERQPWEKLPQETSLAFSYFARWRDLGPTRTYEAAAKSLGVRATLLSGLSKRYHWMDRADAWDEHLDRARCDARLRAAQEMDERHAVLAMLVQEKIITRLEGMDDSEVARIPMNDLMTMLNSATKLERTARVGEGGGSSSKGGGTTVNVNNVNSAQARAEAKAASAVVHVTETIVRTREEVAAAKADPKGEWIDGE